MREIKFRVFYEDRNDMVYFNLGETNRYPSNVMDFPVMQYTGLKDKNGVEIYEGDIIFNSNKTLFTSKEDKRLYLVKWQDPSYNNDGTWLQNKPSFVIEKIKYDNENYMELIFSQSQIEVIGNIYQNPELLK